MKIRTFGFFLAKELSMEMENSKKLDQMHPISEQIKADSVVHDLLKLYNQVLIKYCEHLDIKQLSRIAGMIAEKKRVILFGISEAQLIASDFQYKLMEIGVDAILPVVPTIFWKQEFNVGSGDVTLIISMGGDSRDLLDITSLLQRRESRIVLLQGTEDEKFSVFAEEIINIECTEVIPSMRMIASRTLISFVLDIIYLLIHLNIEGQRVEN